MAITTVGLDLAKDVFQVHGVCEDGSVAFNRAVRRKQLLGFSRTCRHVLSGWRHVVPPTTGHVNCANSAMRFGLCQRFT